MVFFSSTNILINIKEEEEDIFKVCFFLQRTNALLLSFLKNKIDVEKKMEFTNEV